MKHDIEMLLVGITFIVIAIIGTQMRQTDQGLRDDVSRVSRIQVQCAGEIDYGQCVDRKLTEWSEGR